MPVFIHGSVIEKSSHMMEDWRKPTHDGLRYVHNINICTVSASCGAMQLLFKAKQGVVWRASFLPSLLCANTVTAGQRKSWLPLDGSRSSEGPCGY